MMVGQGWLLIMIVVKDFFPWMIMFNILVQPYWHASIDRNQLFHSRCASWNIQDELRAGDNSPAGLREWSTE